MRKMIAICLGIIGLCGVSQKAEAYGCCDSYMDNCCPSPTCCYNPCDNCCGCDSCFGGCCRPGFYIGGEVGYAWIHTPTNGLPEDCVCVQEDEEKHCNGNHGHFAWGVFGGWNTRLCCWPSVFLGVEVGYNDNGYSHFHLHNYYVDEEEVEHEHHHRLKFHNRDWNISGTFTYVFCNTFNVFAKLGAARVHESVDTHRHCGCDWDYESYPDLFCNSRNHNWAGVFKVGAGYCIFDCINLYAAYRGIFTRNNGCFDDCFENISCEGEYPYFRANHASRVHSVYGGLTYTF